MPIQLNNKTLYLNSSDAKKSKAAVRTPPAILQEIGDYMKSTVWASDSDETRDAQVIHGRLLSRLSLSEFDSVRE